MALSAQEVADRIEIDDLLIRYTRAIDDKDWALLDTVFTPDADVDYVSSGGIAGKYPEVRECLGKALAMFPVTLHAISNSSIELDGDRAKGRTLVNNPMCVEEDGKPKFAFTVWAYYHDDLVRTADGWRIAKRYEEQLLMQGAFPPGLTPPA
jgi:3-phenylpropionate/cinnamic acid dioxygenase small subunit